MTDEQEWLEYVPEILSAIEDGLLDTKIRDIAKACYDRHTALDGGLGKAVGIATVAPRKYTGVVYGEGGLNLRYWSGNKPARYFTYRDKTYSKDEFEGKVARITSTHGSWYLRDLLVTVVKINKVIIAVRFAEDPTVVYPKSDVLRKYWDHQQVNRDWYFKLDLAAFDHVFEK